jgi:predicted alpha/beta hydrolase
MDSRRLSPPLTAAAPPAASPNTWLVADDGRRLAADWFEPPAARAVAVVSSAAGVPRGFYRAFAHWLAGRGYAVLTYDYRGIAGSRAARPRAETATMRDWSLLDMSAALAAAEARRAGRPLLLIGHSFGGNSIGFARGVERADAILTVGSQLGEARLYPALQRAVVEVFFRAWLPAVVGTLGYAPGWALGGGAEALPGGVARDWSAWGLQRGWAMGDAALQPHARFAAVRAPVHLWNVTDDLQYAPPRTVDALAGQFTQARVRRHTLAPADVGVRRLGHFGAFRRTPGVPLWQRLLAPVEAELPALR